jgi:hypothetical protein
MGFRLGGAVYDDDPVRGDADRSRRGLLEANYLVSYGGRGSGKDPRLPTLIFVVLVLIVLTGATYALLFVKDKVSLVVGGVALIAIQLWFATIRRWGVELLTRIGSSYREIKRRVRIAMAAGTVIVLTASGLIIYWMTLDDPCPHPIELRILTSSEGLQTAHELARAYSEFTARDNDGCPEVFAYAYAATTKVVSSPLARGWVDTKTEHPYVDVGPRPDIWLPDSTLDVHDVYDTVIRSLGDAVAPMNLLPKPLARITSIASSPIVLARVGSSPESRQSGNVTFPGMVSSLLGVPGATLAAADPESSAAGLLAASGYLHDGNDQLVDPVVARQRQQLVFRSTRSASDEASLLCDTVRQGADAPRAVLTSLRTWRRLMDGKPMGEAGCPASAGTVPDTAAEPIAAEDAPALDLPLVQFTWTSENPRQQQAADGFRAWLLSKDGRARLDEAGLDPPINGCGGLIHNPCLPDDLAATLKRYQQAKAPGRVLLAVDTSGSMAERTASGATRSAVAVQGVTAALGQLGEHDEFRLWTFPGRGHDFTELSDLAAGSAQRRSSIVGPLRAVRPSGATPLYATIFAGMQKVSTGDDAQIEAMVVLTDGDDTTSELSPQQAADKIKKLTTRSGPRLYLIATGEARCEDTPGRIGTGLHMLTDAGQGGCLQVDTGKVEATMNQIFESLWSGR